MPGVDPEFGISNLPPTDTVLGVLGSAFTTVKLSTDMVTPLPAAIVVENEMTVAEYGQLPLLQATLKTPALPTFVFDRITPPLAVRVRLVPIVMEQLEHDGSTENVPKSSF